MGQDRNIETTFCFLDIAGYTALTDAHRETATADLVDHFAELIRTSVEPLGHLNTSRRQLEDYIGYSFYFFGMVNNYSQRKVVEVEKVFKAATDVVWFGFWSCRNSASKNNTLLIVFLNRRYYLYI
jgi:class 3 adenylate cyclase